MLTAKTYYIVYGRIKTIDSIVAKSFALFICLFIGLTATSQETNLVISENSAASSFPLIKDNVSTTIYYDALDAKVVHIAAEAFAKDLWSVSGREVSVLSSTEMKGEYVVLAGTIGHSAFIDKLIQSKKIKVAAILDKWESFMVSVIDQPFPGIKKALVIAGSDRRATAFGIFHLSRTMGVSPFVWWADVVPAKHKELFVSGSYTSSSPSVKYRGIFINDEDWGLQPWAAKNMDTDINDIGPKTYAKVFELMLRLKANYIWPAMHPCTKAFYYYKDNPKVADEYAIIVGGSHCEPMLRNNVFEWAENFEHEYGKKPGEWRYDLNKNEIYKYWDDRVKEATNYESVYTVGMRGVHDGSMPGPKDPDKKMKLLEDVINDQRKILGLHFNSKASEVPQIFVPYKEVLSLYRRGLHLADDVTIIWPDDNHGYIRQLPDEDERKRSGRHGVYYHLSYWGSPADYLWLSSISPSLISYEMSKAYDYGADRLWVFNVGDIKPAELELQFAMDMAWDINKWRPDKAFDYTRAWAEEIFGKKSARDIAEIKNEYYLLASSGKPEHVNAVEFSLEEAIGRLARYKALFLKAEKVKIDIPAALLDAYYELVLYPVTGAKWMNDKILLAKISFANYNKEPGGPDYSEMAKQAFTDIKELTLLYNLTLGSGKWNGIMSWQPRDQPVFKMPLTAFSANSSQRDSLSAKYFKTPVPQLILQASAYTSKKETADGSIQTINGLGISGKGLTVVGVNNKTDNILARAPVSVEFELPASLDTGEYEIEVKCLPTFDVNTSDHLYYSIGINNEIPHLGNVHAEADSKEWKENVLRGYSSFKTIHSIPKRDKNIVRIIFRDINLVINTIEFHKLTNTTVK